MLLHLVGRCLVCSWRVRGVGSCWMNIALESAFRLQVARIRLRLVIRAKRLVCLMYIALQGLLSGWLQRVGPPNLELLISLFASSRRAAAVVMALMIVLISEGGIQSIQLRSWMKSNRVALHMARGDERVSIHPARKALSLRVLVANGGTVDPERRPALSRIAKRSQPLIIVSVGQCSSWFGICYRIRHSSRRTSFAILAHVQLLEQFLFLLSLLLNDLLPAEIALKLPGAERRLVVASS